MEAQRALAVLIADDEPDVVESLAELVAFYGHGVRTARSGDEALRLAEAELPDVVLLDIRMPGADGCSVARLLRARTEGRKRPFLVAVTGCSTPTDRNNTTAAGFDLHLVKPAQPELIIGLLERLRKLFMLQPAGPESGTR